MSLASEVVMSTVDLPRTDWLTARKSGLGGSDVAKITGHSKYGSRMTVYTDKTTDEVDDTMPSEAAELGTELEDFVAWKFTQKTGKKVRRKNAILRHPEYPWMMANVDRLIVGEEAGLECKTASEYLKTEWVDDEVPTAYYLQCQHYMAVTGYKEWWIAVLIGGNKFRYKLIERSEGVIQELIRLESEFWNNHVVPRIPPEMDGSEASAALLTEMYPESNGVTDIELAPDAAELIKQYEEADELIKEIEAKKTEFANKLKALLGENEIGWSGERKVVWKSISRTTVDSKALKEQLPDIYTKFSKTSSSRRFEIK